MNVLGKPTTLDAVECLLGDFRGQYIPRDFIASFDIKEWGIDPESWEANVCADPEHEHYWDAWEEILNHAEFHKDGYVWRLYQEGDLWAVCPELMTDEEKANFGWED